jgi:hypothetical protein
LGKLFKKKLLDDHGLSDMMTEGYKPYIPKYVLLFSKSKVIDCFKQEWFRAIGRNSVLDEYKDF